MVQAPNAVTVFQGHLVYLCLAHLSLYHSKEGDEQDLDCLPCNLLHTTFPILPQPSCFSSC